MLMNTQEYLSIIGKIKQEIKDAQYRAAVHVNADMLILYYDIGCVINEHKSWGNKFIDNLATDIKIAFPDYPANYWLFCIRLHQSALKYP